MHEKTLIWLRLHKLWLMIRIKKNVYAVSANIWTGFGGEDS